MIYHVTNHDYEDESSFVGPFASRTAAATYLADPQNYMVDYFEPDEHSSEPYVQTAKKNTAMWENTTRKQLIRIARDREEGFVYSGYGDFMQIVELRKRKRR